VLSLRVGALAVLVKVWCACCGKSAAGWLGFVLKFGHMHAGINVMP
jgi:hypothetical protein